MQGDGHDPLIHGPRADSSAGESSVAQGSGAKASEHSATPPSFVPAPVKLDDLAAEFPERAPWRDAWELLYRPQSFFRSLSRASKEPKLFLKAALVFVLFSWIANGLSLFVFGAGDWLDSLEQLNVEITTNGAIPPAYAAMLKRLPFAELRDNLRGLGLIFTASSYLLGPFLSLAWFFVNALIGTWWLRRLAPEGDRVELATVFLTQVFAAWFVAVGILPFVGAMFAALITFLYTVFGLSWAYDVSFTRAFLSIRFLEILGLLLAVGAFAVIVLTLALTLS